VKVQLVKIGKLTPYFRNPRDNEDAVGAVAKSISEYGFNSPIVADEKYVVIAGHTRLKAAMMLGLEEVPVVIVRLSEERAKEYRIADNKTAEFSEWNMNDLVAELRELDDMSGFFPMLDVAALLAETSGAANYVSPGQAEIDGVKRSLETHYTEKSDEARDRYLRLICPSCGEEFYVDRREAKKVANRKEGE
jgi:ParB-like chromosome segregation protein Spo0J